MILVKRVYARADALDGKRVLVDRLWPRGLTKEKAAVDLWLKEIAPSDRLRTWFSHDPAKWNEFQQRYAKELDEKTELVQQLKKMEKENGAVTLLFSARDENYNNAVALRKYLEHF